MDTFSLGKVIKLNVHKKQETKYYIHSKTKLTLKEEIAGDSKVSFISDKQEYRLKEPKQSFSIYKTNEKQY